VAPGAQPVAIMGASGTGKELVARALHAESRRPGAFVPVNAAVAPALLDRLLFGGPGGADEGAFGRAAGGTLFLDEVCELQPETQARLLHVLEQGVQARLVSASDVPLERAVADGLFRPDLYARLVGVRISTPPLHERREDLLLLFQHFVRPTAGARPVTADFVEALLLHPWSRNLGELHDLATRLCLLHGLATRWELEMLGDELVRRVLVRGRETGDTAPVRIAGPPARDQLVELLARFHGDVTEVARFVGRKRTQVFRWMDQHGIPRPSR